MPNAVCLQCRFEFNAGILICADCGTKLVPELPRDEGVEYVDWKIIQSVSSEILGNILKGVLEDGGIETSLRSHGMPSVGGVQGSFSPDWGDILVHPEDLRDAQNLVEQYFASLTLDQSDESDSESNAN